MTKLFQIFVGALAAAPLVPRELLVAIISCPGYFVKGKSENLTILNVRNLTGLLSKEVYSS